MPSLYPLIFAVATVATAAFGDVSTVLRGRLATHVTPIHLLDELAKPSQQDVDQPDPGSTPIAIICVAVLTGAYFGVHTALAASRMSADSRNLQYSKVTHHNVLHAASLTVNYAPVVAVFILGCYMHISYLTRQGGSPPDYVRICMITCTGAVVLMTGCAGTVSAFTGTRSTDSESEVKEAKSSTLTRFLVGAQYIFLLSLYGATGCAMYYTATFAPASAPSLPLCPSIQCVGILVVQFFTVYLLILVAHTNTQLNGVAGTKFANAMLSAGYAANMTGILGALFLGVRMHAVHVDPEHGHLQGWAERCIYGATFSTTVMVVLSVVVVVVLQGETLGSEDDTDDNDKLYNVQYKICGSFLIGARYAMLICICFAVMHIISAIFILESPKGEKHTPSVSIALRCVVHLTLQFLTVYLVIWIGVTVKEVTGKQWLLLTHTMQKVRDAVALCSMLAPLFLAVHIRGLQITNNVAGVPQTWIEDGMSMATGAILIQLLMAFVTAMCAGTPKKHAKGQEVQVLAPEVLWTGWLGLLFMYLGLITVIVGLHVMTPEVDVHHGRERHKIPTSEYEVSPLHARGPGEGLTYNMFSHYAG